LDADYFVVLTTLPRDHDADRFATTLVEERLAACVSVLAPMRSTYTWKGAVERTDERQIVIKTTRSRLRDLEARIRAIHPYDVPEFLALPITEGSQSYLTWLSDSTQ